MLDPTAVDMLLFFLNNAHLLIHLHLTWSLGQLLAFQRLSVYHRRCLCTRAFSYLGLCAASFYAIRTGTAGVFF